MNLFSLAVPSGVRIREYEPALTVSELLKLRSYNNPVITEARLVQQAKDHQERLNAIFAEHWGQP
jgi:hypothetical protein